MTIEKQMMAILELDGKGLYECPCGNCNPYLTSRDAIVPVIEKVCNTEELSRKFCYALFDILKRDGVVTTAFSFTWLIVIKATAKHLCEALLRATGKWKD